MTAEVTYYPYLGSGKIYAREAGTSTGLMDWGNTSQLDLSVSEEKQKQKDYTKPGGGTHASVSRIDSVMAKAKLHDLNKKNIARSLFGTASAVAGATITDEVITAYKDAIVPLAHINPTGVVVTNTAASTTYVEGTDYEVRPGGIFILDAGSIADATSLKVDYTFVGYSKVEAMTKGSIILELHFEGLNEANSGKAVIVDVYRLQMSPTKALALLGDKFSDLEVEGEVLKDTTKIGVGISQYFKARMTD